MQVHDKTFDGKAEMTSIDGQAEAFQWFPGVNIKEYGKITGSKNNGYLFINADYKKPIFPGDWIIWLKFGYVSIIGKEDFIKTTAAIGIEFPANSE